MDSRSEAFVRVLKFLDLDLDPDRSALKVAFKKALNAAKPESLRNLETALGSGLGRDQTDAGESHLRGGEVGKWTSQLSEEDLRFVGARLTGCVRYGLTSGSSGANVSFSADSDGSSPDTGCLEQGTRRSVGDPKPASCLQITPDQNVLADEFVRETDGY